MRKSFSSLTVAAAAVLFGWAPLASAQVVPGTGQRIVEVGDDFEDPNWTFTLNLPKASSNIDKVVRGPSGFASNNMWFESDFRGTPDFVKRVETPEGGIAGSTGALALQTLYSGIPGQLSHKMQQDDLIANVQHRLGYMLPASWTPSYVVRVYVPSFEKWEQRVGSSFGFRADCQTIINKPTKVGKFFRTGGTSREMEQYWPGFFIQFNGKTHPQHTDKNTATILIRSGERGQDIPGPVITESGWWTLGMTITPDGKVHYYGHAGVADLTAKDHLYSNFPYGYTCLQTSTYFFNVVNQDDGKSWSTRWIVDDPKVYVATGSYVPSKPQVAQVPVQPVSQVKTTPAATTPPAPQTAAPSQPPTTPATPPLATSPAAPAVAAPPALNSTVVPMPTTAPVVPSTIPTKLPMGKFDAPVQPTVPAATSAPAVTTPSVTPPAAAPATTLPSLNSTVTPPVTAPQPAVAPPLSFKPTVPAQPVAAPANKNVLDVLGLLLSTPPSASPAKTEGATSPDPKAAQPKIEPAKPEVAPTTEAKPADATSAAGVTFSLPVVRRSVSPNTALEVKIEPASGKLPELSKATTGAIPSPAPAPALLPVEGSDAKISVEVLQKK